MRLFLILVLYNLLLPFALLVMLPGAWKKMKLRGGNVRDLLQRFARYPREVRVWLGKNPRPLWIHAVSVGEVQVALKMVRELAARRPDLKVVMTTTTPTGYAIASKEMVGLGGMALYNPVDLLPVAIAALREIRPCGIVLTEAEVWPNQTWLAQRSGIPVILANARMSPRSEKRMKKFSGILGPIYSLLTETFVQEPGDVARWSGIGVPEERIKHVGSVKYDPGDEENENDARMGEFQAILDGVFSGKQTVVMAVSTHPGEEALIGAAVMKLDGCAYVVVPRHFERASEVAADLRGIGLTPVLRTVGGDGDCLIVDSTGELKVWTELADVVVVGKSFCSTGGQNPAEAALAGKAIVMGPEMSNFMPLVDLLTREGGAVHLAETEELEGALRNLIGDDEERKAMGGRARAALEVHRGATGRTVEGILEKLG